MTRWGYLAFVLALALVGAAVVCHVRADALPGDKIPIHWDINGNVDGWASKDQPFVAFYLLPTAVAGIVALGLLVLPWASPRNFAVEGFRRVYDFIFFLVTALFAYIDGVIMTATLREAPLDPRWLLAGIFVFFAVIAPPLAKVKQNFWMGVRTPWTLADPIVWERTHRMAAWTMGLSGVIGGLLVIVGVNWIACFVLLMIGALSPVVYSLVAYKQMERAGQLESQQTVAAPH
jgi:uncharacterized membrane protein